MILDYPKRLDKLRTGMEARGVGLMFLPPGANLFYLTGIRRREAGGTDHNAYGDWAVGALLGLKGDLQLVIPRMGGAFFENQVRDKPWISSVAVVQESEDPLDVLRQLLPREGLNGERVALDDRAWAKTVLAFRQILPEADFVTASELIAPLRIIKDEAEIALMRKAGDITGLVFGQALARLRVGTTEVEVENEIDYQFKRCGAEYTSFVTEVEFVGAPRDPKTPPAERKLAPGDSVTFDFGCVYEGYCSDFGRCAYAGEPEPEYLRIHDLVLLAQGEALKAMMAGQITGAGANSVAREVIRGAGYDAYFTHRLGHGIGVTVHEPPWLDVVEQTVLSANMTFTVEPSIRIPGRLGNRVEDVVVITDAGAISLYDVDHCLYLVE